LKWVKVDELYRRESSPGGDDNDVGSAVPHLTTAKPLFGIGISIMRPSPVQHAILQRRP